VKTPGPQTIFRKLLARKQKNLQSVETIPCEVGGNDPNLSTRTAESVDVVVNQENLNSENVNKSNETIEEESTNLATNFTEETAVVPINSLESKTQKSVDFSVDDQVNPPIVISDESEELDNAWGGENGNINCEAAENFTEKSDRNKDKFTFRGSFQPSQTSSTIKNLGARPKVFDKTLDITEQSLS
jgi:hypothetical protein